jgi:hypothetical protein
MSVIISRRVQFTPLRSSKGSRREELNIIALQGGVLAGAASAWMEAPQILSPDDKVGCSREGWPGTISAGSSISVGWPRPLPWTARRCGSQSRRHSRALDDAVLEYALLTAVHDITGRATLNHAGVWEVIYSAMASLVTSVDTKIDELEEPAGAAGQILRLFNSRQGRTQQT